MEIIEVNFGLDGNRKEALKEFVKEIEDTIEHNIIKNGECSDLLADFFDAKMNSLLVVKNFFPDMNLISF